MKRSGEDGGQKRQKGPRPGDREKRSVFERKTVRLGVGFNLREEREGKRAKRETWMRETSGSGESEEAP